MERFGIPSDIVSIYDFYEFAKGVWATTSPILPSSRIETVGIRALRISRDLKPTTSFLRVVGMHARKNVVVLDEDQAIPFLRGGEIGGVCGDMQGYVVVRTSRDVLGCGLCRNATLVSQVPKKYRPEDSWV